MDKRIYDEIYKIWINRKPEERIWTTELANRFLFPSAEALRSSFRRQRKSIGVVDRKPVFGVSGTPNEKIHTGAKILLFDIETGLINALVWGIWEQNINIEAILQDWHVLSWSAKWIFDDQIVSDVLTPAEAKRHDDFRIVKSLWELLDQADIVVSHNGNKFDHKRMNTRFLFHGLPPLSHYRSVDTLEVAKNTFSFTSNKLDYINAFLGISRKSETNFELWKRAYFGDEEALEELKDYNVQDTVVLEELFLKLRPYIKNFPNLNLFTEDNTSVCRNCGSEHLTWSGYYYTNVSRYKGWRCDNCGAIGRSRFSDLESDKKKGIVV